MDELKKFIAENDIELPEDILQAVAGGKDCGGTISFVTNSDGNFDVSVSFDTSFKKPGQN